MKKPNEPDSDPESIPENREILERTIYLNSIEVQILKKMLRERDDGQKN